MSFEVGGLRERSPALLTVEVLLSSVRQLVFFERVCREETLSALRAEKQIIS